MEKFSIDFWNFILQHGNDDAGRLRLKYAGNEKISWAIDQIEARKKIDRKLPLFSENGRLLFPSVLSAEQASSEDTALYKQQILSGRFDTICDLTGGLGIDSYYMARIASQLTYIERFSHYCDIARHNFKELRQNNIHVLNGDCRDFLKSSHQRCDLYYIDPARRGSGNKRLYNLADCEPSVLEILPIVLAEKASLLLKASPMLDIKQTINDLGKVSEIHILSVKNECKELLFLVEPNHAGDPRIYCSNKTLDNKWQTYTFFLAEESLLPSSPVCTLQEYLYEPNSSILKAGAFKSIAQSFGIDKLAVSSHLYTSRKYVSDFPGRAFEILEAYPFSKQVLKKCSRKYPQANVSTRNFPLTPDEIRRLGGIKDGGDIYLFATMVNSEKTMIYCRKK